MDSETFTIEITPENDGSLTSANACFQLTLDVGDGAPTFSATSSVKPGSADRGWTWPNSQQSWYQAAPNAGYYNPYYYNCGYYQAAQGAGASSVPSSNDQNFPIETASPLPHAPILPMPVASQPSQPSLPTNKQESKSKSPQKRLPTPHPRRPSAAAASFSSSRPKVANPKGKDVTKEVGIAYLPKSRVQLSERLNRLSLPSKELSGEEPKKKSTCEIVGRPLWSGNFSGANSPAQTAVPCKPKPGAATVLESNCVLPESSKNLEKQQTPGVENKAATPKKINSEHPERSTKAAPGQPSSSSPLVQYVSYNYRPVVVQSPTCGNGTMFDASGRNANSGGGRIFLPTASFADTRFRTTSTLETICPSTD
jgi:hypothetical protein